MKRKVRLSGTVVIEYWTDTDYYDAPEGEQVTDELIFATDINGFYDDPLSFIDYDEDSPSDKVEFLNMRGEIIE